jgi:non-homologous end joining protein Ku
LVKRKAAGKSIKVAEPEERPDNVINLMDALRQSLGERGKPAKAVKPHKRKAARKTGRKAQKAA